LHEKFNINGKILGVLCDYFINRTFKISNGKYISKDFNLNVGLAQGSVLACFLFNCYYNSVFESIPGVRYCIFADDLCIYCENTSETVLTEHLTSTLASLNSWCIKMKMQINFSKTKYMIFHKPQNKVQNDLTIQVCNVTIEKVSSFKYLGLYLDENLNYELHFNHVCTKLSAAIGCMNLSRKYLNEKTFIIMLNTFLYSVIDYGLIIWGCICPTKLDYLQQKINNCIKTFFFPVLSKLFSKDFWNKTNISNNALHSTRKNLRALNNKIEMNALLEKCNVLSVRERYDYYLLLSVFKTMKPICNIKHLKEFYSFHKRNGTISPGHRLEVPNIYTKLSKISQNSVQYKAISLFNKIPTNIRENSNLSIASFKNSISIWCMRERN
jgi:hypothetical protein